MVKSMVILAAGVLLNAMLSMSFGQFRCRSRSLSTFIMKTVCDIESFMSEISEEAKVPSILHLTSSQKRIEWKPSSKKKNMDINIESLMSEVSEESKFSSTLHLTSSQKRTEWTSSKNYEQKLSSPKAYAQPIQLKNYTSSTWAPAAGYKDNRSGIDKPSSQRNHSIPNSSVELLQRPMLYVKYRIPRRVTDTKKLLVANQDIFRKTSEDLSSINVERTSERKGSIDGGRISNRSPPKEMNFDSPRYRSSSSAGKKKVSDQPLPNRKRSGSPIKSGHHRDDSVHDDSDILNDSGHGFLDEDGEDYEDFNSTNQSQELDEVVHLNDIDDAEILQLVNDDLELGQIMSILITQYGIRTSFKDLRARISEAKQDNSRRRKTGKTRRDRKKDFIARTSPVLDSSKIVKLSLEPTISIKALAELMGHPTGEILKYLMVNEGMLININQSIPREMAEKVLAAFGKIVEQEDELEMLEKQLQALDMAEDSNNESKDGPSMFASVSRSPVVTIMGHVDHGKTSLLDRIRKARVAQTEAGGITQAISAFKVPIGSILEEENTNRERAITFIDTPGHAAFSEMRKRGAKMTDIIVLVIAADDGIMEQTRECIQAAKVAQCPIVVAINKVDKVGANADKVKQDLLNEGLLVEEYGGDVQVATVSAKTGEGIDDLLDKILLQAEVMSLVARKDGDVEGTVVEGSIDKRLGVVVTALVQQGTIKVGQCLVCGTSYGKVRRLLNDKGESILEAGPSSPVRIIGMNRVPDAGDSIIQIDSDTLAKEMSEARLRYMKDTNFMVSSNALREQSSVGLINGTLDRRERLTIHVVIKADVAGSLEALISSLSKIVIEDNNAVCKIDVVYSGVGDVSTSDVAIAASAKAHVIAFNVAATIFGQEESRAKNVDIKYYNVLYDVLNDLQKMAETTITPPAPGVSLGKAIIKKIFTIGRTGKVAGCLVESGKILRNAQIRVLRGKTQVFVGMLANLKVIKDETDQVEEGNECGMTLRGFEDFLEGDIIECFQVDSFDDNDRM